MFVASGVTTSIPEILCAVGWYAVLEIRIRDPVLFCPLDLDPGSGISYFQILDPYNLCKLAQFVPI
jgi:hypothetical protein